MKTNLHLFLALALLADINGAKAQQPVISSFSQNGVLVCTNLEPGALAGVEWASSVAGPRHTNWAGLDTVPVSTNGIIQVGLPMYYRVRVEASMPPPPVGTSGMVLIPGGTFMMGDACDGMGVAIPTNVYVSGFYMDTNLVTWSQWQGVYAYATIHGYGFANAGAGKAADHPVQTVNWYDCVKWCNARS